MKEKDKTNAEKELQRLKFIKKDLETNGLKSYEKHKDLVLEYVIKGIDRDIKEYEKEVEKYNEK